MRWDSEVIEYCCGNHSIPPYPMLLGPNFIFEQVGIGPILWFSPDVFVTGVFKCKNVYRYEFLTEFGFRTLFFTEIGYCIGDLGAASFVLHNSVLPHHRDKLAPFVGWGKVDGSESWVFWSRYGWFRAYKDVPLPTFDWIPRKWRGHTCSSLYGLKDVLRSIGHSVLRENVSWLKGRGKWPTLLQAIYI